MKKNILKLATLLLLVILQKPLSSQFLGVESLGTTGTENSPFSIQTTDGGIVTVFSSNPPGSAKRQLVIRKIGADGAQLWINQIRDSVDLTPVCVKEERLNSHNIFILANATYSSKANDVHFIKIDGTNGNYVGTRELKVDATVFGLPANHRYPLLGYDMIYLNNEPETRGDFLIAANFSNQPNPAYTTQMLYKIRPNLSLNWGRHIAISNTLGGAGFQNNGGVLGNVKNAYSSMMELPNGDVVLTGYMNSPLQAVPGSLQLNTVIDVSSATATILTDRRYENQRGFNSAGHSITWNDNTGVFYTTFYGENGIPPSRIGTVANLSYISLINEFSSTLAFNQSYFIGLTGVTNTIGSSSSKLLYNPTDGNLLFLTTYTANNGIGLQNVLGSINTVTRQINWAKTFPILNSNGGALSWNILLLANGTIQLNGVYSNSGNTDIATIVTVNGKAQGACELAVTNLQIVAGPNVNTVNPTRAIEQCESPNNNVYLVSKPTISVGVPCGCPMIRGNAYATIASDTPILNSIVYSGKYYVPDNTIITFSGNSIIDFTNCDVIFGTCSGFAFTGNSRLRANNSVFRTCSETAKWVGMTFGPNATAIINECTYKNAITATRFSGTNTNGEFVNGEIANNLFQNCGTSINIFNVNSFNGSIDGNTFEISNPTGVYNLCGGTLPLNEFHMIDITGSTLLASISQNKFYNRSSTSPGLVVRAIVMNNALSYISQNSFANLSQSIACYGKTNTKHMLITNNDIEIDKPNIGSIYLNQILIQQSISVKIMGNKLYNSVLTMSGNAPRVAIYAQRTIQDVIGAHQILIKDNNITGFDVGIQATLMNNISIIQNTITDSRMYGISSNGCKTIDFSCNKIDLDQANRDPLLDLGIGIYSYNTSSISNFPNYIQSNCIFDTKTAIKMESSTSYPMPTIRNNFLYNFTNFGIDNKNHTGNIGTTTLSGLNTFYGVGSGLDINSNVAINAVDNYYSGSFPFTVSLAGSYDMQSIATCGHQVVQNQTMPSKFDNSLSCNKTSNLGLYPILAAGSELRIDPGFNGKLNDFVKEPTFEILMNCLPILTSLDENIANTLYNEVTNNSINLNLDKTQLLLLQYSMEYQKKNWPIILTLLNTKEMSEYLGQTNLKLEQINIKMIAGLEIDNSEKQFLDEIYVTGNLEQKEKVNAIKNSAGLIGFVPDSEPIRIAESTSTEGSKKYSVTKNIATLFPNPFSNEINIQFVNRNAQNMKFKLFSLTGQEIDKIEFIQKAGSIVINTQNLSKGAYVINVTNDEGFSQSYKVLKF